MEEITRETLLSKIGSLFKLSNVAAMRAMELNAGMKRLVDADPNEKNTIIAIREIAHDKVKLKKAKKEA